MTPEEQKRMDSLVDRIQVEKNHAKFTILVEELNDLLGRRAKRLAADGHAKSLETLPPMSNLSSE
jgi:hypothetical protein